MGTLIAVTRLARQRGATIARLRRMLGQTSSEKTANVVGAKGAAAPTSDGCPTASGQDEPVPDEPPGGETKDEAANDTGGAAEGNDKPRRKGHGRIPGSQAYASEKHRRPAFDAVHRAAVSGVRARHAVRDEGARLLRARLRPGAARGAPMGLRVPAL